MRKTGPLIFPLSAAHITGLLALQAAAALAFISPALAALPLAGFCAICLSAPFFPGFAFYLPVVSRGKRGGNSVALTFDDGPDPAVTPLLLDLLARENTKAAFFITGENALRHPEIVKMIIANGHEIGNHSLDHDPLLMLRRARRLGKNIGDAREIFKSEFGILTLAFRPPVGITNPLLWGEILRMGMLCVTFSRRAYDGIAGRTDGMAGKILGRLSPGDIIVLHDRRPVGEEEPGPWLEEVGKILRGIREKGLEPAPLSVLLGRDIMRAYRPGDPEPGPAELFYDSLAPDYDREQLHSGVSFARRREMEIVLPRMREIFARSGRALEVGAGTGLFSLPLAGLCRELVAVDVSGCMLAKLREKAEASGMANIRVVKGDIECMTLEGKFDSACSFSSLEYVGDLPALFRKLHTCMNEGAVIYFTTARRGFFRLFTQLGNACRQGIWLRARTEREIRDALTEAGFAVTGISSHVLKMAFTGGMLLEVTARKKSAG